MPNPAGGKAPPPPPPKPEDCCACGAVMYYPPPKGKKKGPIHHEHHPGCVYQRTTCDAFPHLPPCEVCQYPCKFCMGKYRWCPHCWETQCTHRYRRVVVGSTPACPPTTLITTGKAEPTQEFLTRMNTTSTIAVTGAGSGGGPKDETTLRLAWTETKPQGLRPAVLPIYDLKLPSKKKEKKKKK